MLAEKPVPGQGSTEWGLAFEHLVYHELRSWLEYSGDYRPLTYWRTHDGREVDFIVGNEMAIEVKASRNIQSGDMKGLRDITGEGAWKARILVCREPVPRYTDDGILILPVTEFLERLWAGSFA